MFVAHANNKAFSWNYDTDYDVNITRFSKYVWSFSNIYTKLKN